MVLYHAAMSLTYTLTCVILSLDEPITADADGNSSLRPAATVSALFILR